MKIDLTKSSFPNKSYEKWNISFEIAESTSGEVFRIDSSSSQPLITAQLSDNSLDIELHYDSNETPLHLNAAISAPIKLTVSATPAYIFLSDGKRILDEEWPLGKMDFSNASCSSGVVASFTDENTEEPPFKKEYTSDIENWKPYGDNTNIGDCMPFADGDIYRLYYLFDRRHHKSKWCLGGHRWAQVSSKDLVNWETHPIAIGIDEQYEGSICTGSVFKHNGTYYAYYAVRMSDRSPALLTWSTSTDGETFIKSKRYITLKEPYEGVSARDPKVFETDDGVFHMLVTTSVVDKEVGALAHLVSENLEEWKQLDPFVTLDIANQPECSDYFKFGDWYYLVYSNFGIAKWFKSKYPLGPWEAPENNLVAAQNVGVPKAAIIKNRLIFAGFTKEGKGYGGNFIFYEGLQKENGDLDFKKVF